MLLNTEIYREMPRSLDRQSSWGLIGLIAVLLPVLLPALTLLHVFFPQHKLAVMASSPQMKFLTYVISYAMFVGFLIRNTTFPASHLAHEVAVGEQ